MLEEEGRDNEGKLAEIELNLGYPLAQCAVDGMVFVPLKVPLTLHMLISVLWDDVGCTDCPSCSPRSTLINVLPFRLIIISTQTGAWVHLLQVCSAFVGFSPLRGFGPFGPHCPRCHRRHAADFPLLAGGVVWACADGESLVSTVVLKCHSSYIYMYYMSFYL